MPMDIDATIGLVLAEDGPGDRERFVRVFRRVWQSLRPDYRDRIIRYWAKFPGSPLVEMITGYRYPGENDDYGCIIRFNAAAVDWMPEEKLAGLIAHELGHVWHYANPDSESSRLAGRMRIEELNRLKEREA